MNHARAIRVYIFAMLALMVVAAVIIAWVA